MKDTKEIAEAGDLGVKIPEAIYTTSPISFSDFFFTVICRRRHTVTESILTAPRSV